MKISYLLIALFLFASNLANARVTETKKEYRNVCSDCGIEKVFVHQRDIIQPYDQHGNMYSTFFYIGFDAKKWDDVKKYAFVQYIRGCTFESSKKSDGTIERRIGESIVHFGKKQTFVMPEWTFDANTNDPMYYGPLEQDSHLPGGRLALYRWTDKLGEFDEKDSNAYYEILEMPENQRSKLKPRLYVVDTPSVAKYSSASKSFQNVALDFKMCMYKIEDVPATVTKDTKLPEPIMCHDWDSHFEYNFNKKTYERHTGKGLHPFCASQKPMNPAEAWRKELSEQEKQPPAKRITIDLNTLEEIPPSKDPKRTIKRKMESESSYEEPITPHEVLPGA